VLPFKNLSGDPAKEYLADAITEDIVTTLSQWRWFFVIARHSSFTYKNLDIDVRKVGEELGVRYVLTGGVRAAGDRLRLNAQLVDAIEGANIWADRYDRDLIQVQSLDDEIAEQVAASIEPAMLEKEGARTARKSPADFSALDCCYRAMWRFHSMTSTAEREAEDLFREAVSRDPELSLAYSGLARVLYGRAIYGGSETPRDDMKASHAAAQTAINLDPRDAYGYFASSGAGLYLGEHAAALNDARRAIALNPNFAYAQYRLGQVLIFCGDPVGAMAPIERALRLSPYDPQLGQMLETLALAHYQAKDYAGAVTHARLAGQVAGAGVAVLAASLAQQGMVDEAAEAHRRAVRMQPSMQRPMAAPYADPALLEHLREGYRLAGVTARL
jgi:TolB-like protein/Flp pilus assembly protein TadD